MGFFDSDHDRGYEDGKNSGDTLVDLMNEIASVIPINPAYQEGFDEGRASRDDNDNKNS